MTDETRQILNQLDELACRNDETSREVLAVLTALRSSDVRRAYTDDEEYKTISTIPIRRAAFPKLATKVDDGGNVWAPTVGDGRTLGMDPRGADMSIVQLEQRDTSMYGHFETHALMAAGVLGLRVVQRPVKKK